MGGQLHPDILKLANRAAGIYSSQKSSEDASRSSNSKPVQYHLWTSLFLSLSCDIRDYIQSSRMQRLSGELSCAKVLAHVLTTHLVLNSQV